MDTETKTSSVDVSSTINPSPSAAKSPEPNQAHMLALTEAKQGQPRPLEDVISEDFPSFDPESVIVRPFEDEAARDVEFQKGQLDQLAKLTR